MLRNLHRYHEPRSLEEAFELISRGPGVRVIAGGTHIVPSEDPTVEEIVDINGLGFDSISMDEGRLHLGSTVTLKQLADSPISITCFSGVLYEGSVRSSATRHIQNVSTLGGEVVMSARSGLLPTVLMGLGAELRYFDGAYRTVSIEDFYLCPPRGCILTQIELPSPLGHPGCALQVLTFLPNTPPLASVFTFLILRMGLIDSSRVVAGSLPTGDALSEAEERFFPRRLGTVEEFLAGKEPIGEVFAEAGVVATEVLTREQLGNSSQRREVAGHLVEKGLHKSLNLTRNLEDQ